jgi:hypothetical protein
VQKIFLIFVDFYNFRLNGLFDVAFDDGSSQVNIPRRRIRLESAQDLSVVPPVISVIAENRSRDRQFLRDRFKRKHWERVKRASDSEQHLRQRAQKLGLQLRQKKFWKDQTNGESHVRHNQNQDHFVEHSKVPSNFVPTGKCTIEFYFELDCF